MRYYRITIASEQRYLPGIKGFGNPDFHGILSIYRNPGDIWFSAMISALSIMQMDPSEIVIDLFRHIVVSIFC